MEKIWGEEKSEVGPTSRTTLQKKGLHSGYGTLYKWDPQIPQTYSRFYTCVQSPFVRSLSVRHKVLVPPLALHFARDLLKLRRR